MWNRSRRGRARRQGAHGAQCAQARGRGHGVEEEGGSERARGRLPCRRRALPHAQGRVRAIRHPAALAHGQDDHGQGQEGGGRGDARDAQPDRGPLGRLREDRHACPVRGHASRGRRRPLQGRVPATRRHARQERASHDGPVPGRVHPARARVPERFERQGAVGRRRGPTRALLVHRQR